MARDQETFNVGLYNLLKTRGYKPVPKDLKNKRTHPELAQVFSFQFTKDGESYGTAWVSIDSAHTLVLYYDNEQDKSPRGKTPGLEYDDSWYGFKKHLKQWAMSRQLAFELKNRDELGDDIARREFTSKRDLSEAYHPLNKKTSMCDAVPSVKIILQHNKTLGEGEQRYRNVAKIYLENVEGERFLAPTTRPSIAQVYARHIAEGGLPNDERWNHIKSLCEEYGKLAGFVRATRNKQFNESTQELINTGTEHYQTLRETLSKLRGHRGYSAYFENWTPTLVEDDVDDDISELFIQETLDQRIEQAIPIISRLKKTSTIKEVVELEEWAEEITEDELWLESK